jgi:hypothetical protein
VFSTERGDTVARVKFQWREDCKESKAPCAVWGISISMDGNYVVLSGTDKTVRVMDIAHNMEFRVVELPASALYAILSADDRFMATASQDLMGRGRCGKLAGSLARALASRRLLSSGIHC